MRRATASLFFAAAYFICAPRGLAVERLVPSEYPTIQAAIDAAIDGDTVIIAPGTYTGEGNRNVDFRGKPITVRSVDPNDPNVVAATVIDCEKQGRGFYLNECRGAVISGLTITNGLAEAGGGVYIEKSEVTVQHCRITGNRASDGEKGVTGRAGDGGHGGGICCLDSSTVVQDCNVSDNSAGDGGSGSDDPDVCEWGCDAGDGGRGGGIYAESSSVTVEATALTSNKAGNGGTGYFANIPGVGGSGGGIYCSSSTIVVEGCYITEDAAGDGGDRSYHGDGGNAGNGGGLGCADASCVTVHDSTIARNAAGKGGVGDDATGYGGGGGDGGGIWCGEDSSIEFLGCTLEENMAGDGAYPDSVGGKGGAVCCMSSSPLDLVGCVIVGNRSGGNMGAHGWGGGHGGHGGGIYCSSAVIKNSTIRDNATAEGGPDPDHAFGGGDGGGVYCTGSLQIVGCAVDGNRTGKGGDSSSWGGGSGGAGGGIWANSVMASGCSIADNETGKGGEGGIHGTNGDGGHGGGIYCTEVFLAACEVANNRTGEGGKGANAAGSGGHGAGLFCGGHASVIDSSFVGNATGNGRQQGMGCGDGGAGGAICSGSGIITNCLIAGNTTGDGGSSMCGVPGRGGGGAGLYLRSSSSPSAIQNCAIVGNVTGEYLAKQGPGQYVTKKADGGGLYARETTSLTDSIIWGNFPEQLFGVDCDKVTFCDISDDECIGMAGNISADPCFVQPGYWADPNDPNLVVELNYPNAVWIMGDYHLSHVAAGEAVDSPCVDAGSDTAANLGMDQLTTRTDKVADEGIVDMGYHYRENIADLNEDGSVDIVDLTILASQWQQGPGVPSADIASTSGDGLVDDRDLRLFVDNWLWEAGRSGISR